MLINHKQTTVYLHKHSLTQCSLKWHKCSCILLKYINAFLYTFNKVMSFITRASQKCNTEHNKTAWEDHNAPLLCCKPLTSHYVCPPTLSNTTHQKHKSPQDSSFSKYYYYLWYKRFAVTNKKDILQEKQVFIRIKNNLNWTISPFPSNDLFFSHFGNNRLCTRTNSGVWSDFFSVH